MPGNPAYDRATLLALTPATYLAGGYRDAAGKPRFELRTIFAIAAATQLQDTITSLHELAASWEAFKMVLPLQPGAPQARAVAAVGEALETVASLYRMENNPGIRAWLRSCAQAVGTEEDLAALLDHGQAVVRQYAAIMTALERMNRQ